jgi:putative hydrolase of the HAD superfamily
MPIKAVGFDYFGTLIDAKADVNNCIFSMYRHLESSGLTLNFHDFLDSYRDSVRRYRKIRTEELKEVNNCIWLSDSLKNMGHIKEKTDTLVVSAIEQYFNEWQLTLFPDAKPTLKRINEKYKTALVSNFTDTIFLKKSLQMFQITSFLNSIIVSEEVGWRKPHPRIFERFLEAMNVQPEEAVYIGDNLEADIKGSKDSGIKSILIDRQDSKINVENHLRPDFIINSLTELESVIKSIK